MALKNFIKQGTYLTFDRIEYNKSNNYIQANIVVYADETKKEVVLQTSMYVGGAYEALPIKKVVKTEDELMDEAPEYLSLEPNEAMLIELDSATTEYSEHINNFVIYRTPDNNISIQSPLYLFDINTKEVLERDDAGKKFIKLDKYIIKTKQQFDNAVDTPNIVKSFYEILKKMPIS